MAWWRRGGDDPAASSTAGPAQTATRPVDESVGGRLRLIIEADKVAFGGVGFAAQLLPVTVAYQALRDSLPATSADLLPKLEDAFDRATPAGRVYLAELLERVDPSAGRAAWERLAADPAEIVTFSGCIIDREPVAGYARGRLGPGQTRA